MSQPALFSGLIVSTPSPNGRRLRWIRATAWALALHALAVTVFLVVPLLLVETVQPHASLSISPFVDPPPPRQGTAPRAPEVRQGAGGGVAPTPGHLDRATRRDIQPDRVPIAPPEGERQEADPVLADSKGAGGSGGPGHPEGTGEADVGLPGGCPGCDGTGAGGAGGAGDDGVLDVGDPRIMKPVLIEATRAMPRYPELARKAGITGEVVLLIVIQADGTIGEIDVLRAPDQRLGFDLAAIEAVKHWRYRPALLEGHPVAVRAIVQVEFTLAR